VARISHIGSTAVPGLLAKPIVDLWLELRPWLAGRTTVESLTGDGWLVMVASDQPFRLDLNQGHTPQGFAPPVFHLHVVRPGDHDELCFRDHLRQHAAARREYAALKRGLLPRFEHDRDGHTAAKTAFVRRMTAAAREQFPVRQAPPTAALV
jgi:GrpB-like predicted nucleotidyltransferase (UPF0157 family)